MRINCPNCGAPQPVKLPDGGTTPGDSSPGLRGAELRCPECGTGFDCYVLTTE